MPKLCAIKNSDNSRRCFKDAQVPVHRFPSKNPDVRHKWLEIAKNVIKPNINVKNYGICGNHFRAEDYLKPEENVLYWYPVPSVFSGAYYTKFCMASK